MTETIIAIAFGTISVVGLFLAIRTFVKKGKMAPPISPELPTVLDSENERCVCGEPATEPMPYIEREREDDTAASVFFMRHHDRNVYAAPPRLRRTVDLTKPPALCRVHAHVADAKIDEFLYVRVRGLLAEANAKIAIEAASFEKEVLLEALKSSLTKTERATKSAARSPVNGTSNGASNGAGAPAVLS